MKTLFSLNARFVAVLATVIVTTCANAQFSIPVRHCQTDYYHGTHTYQTYSGVYQCPGGAHDHYGAGGYGYGSARRSDPLVAQVQVILVQKNLYHHRHHNQVDGIFGSETRHAVEDFQQVAGLPVTGMLDPATLQALGLGDSSNAAPPTAPSSSPMPPPVAPAPMPNSPSPAEPTAQKSLTEPVEILTLPEAAKLMKLFEEEVIELLEAGELQGKEIGDNWRITRSAIDEYFKSESKPAKEKAKTHGHDHDHDEAKEADKS